MLETRIAKELAYISQAGLARRITELYFVNPAQAQDRTGKITWYWQVIIILVLLMLRKLLKQLPKRL